jgi:hypothetical protein
MAEAKPDLDEARRSADDALASSAPPPHVRLATDVKDVAGHFHRHQDVRFTMDLHGLQFHGLPTGHLVLYKTWIAIRTASH